MTPAHRVATTALMVQQAQVALACHRAGDLPGYHLHRRRARVLADLLQEAQPRPQLPASNPATH